MDKKEKTAETMNFLQHVCTTTLSQAVFEFARSRLETECVKNVLGQEIGAAEYAACLYTNSLRIGTVAGEKENERYAIVALLLALEAAKKGQDNWSYGAKLLYDLDTSGIVITRAVAKAFFAQDGGWDAPAKAELMNSMCASAFYCARLLTFFSAKLNSASETALVVPEEGAPKEIIEQIARKYIPAVGVKPESVDAMLDWMDKAGFYGVPAISQYNAPLQGTKTLAEHSLGVIKWLAKLLAPQADEEIGKAVLAGIAHDFCEVGAYSFENGMWYSADTFPIGHGRKSLHSVAYFFGKSLPEDVASAIDAHAFDAVANPRVYHQMFETPLGLFLHCADILETFAGNGKK